MSMNLQAMLDLFVNVNEDLRISYIKLVLGQHNLESHLLLLPAGPCWGEAMIAKCTFSHSAAARVITQNVWLKRTFNHFTQFQSPVTVHSHHRHTPQIISNGRKQRKSDPDKAYLGGETYQQCRCVKNFRLGGAMLFITHTSTLASICLILIVMVVHSLKMGKSNSIVSDHELIQLRNQLLAELVGQIKESISIGRSCHEQLRLVDGQELVESGQNLLVLIKSREKDFANVFGDTPEVVDRIVSSVEQKVFICHAESNRQILNGLLKIYSQPLLQNETVNLTSMLRGAKTVAHNLTMTFKLDAAKFLLHALNEQIDDSVVLAERYSAIARSMSSSQHRASNRYYYMQLSQALGDSFHSVLTSLYHFSSMVWQVYVQQNPKTSIPMTLLPMSQRDQRGIEHFLQEQQMLYTQPYFQVFHRRFQVKFKSSSVLFYVKCSEPFVLRIDNDICADQGSRIADDANPKDVDITCEAYMEENTTVDIFLFVLNPSIASTETAPLATPPRLLAAREDIMEAFEIKLRRFTPPSATAGSSGTSAGKTST